MASRGIEFWVGLRRGTPGRRAHAAGKVASRLRAHGQEALAREFEALRPNELAQIGRMRLFRAAQGQMTTAQWTPELVAQDLVVDRLVGELADLLAVNGRRKGTPRGDAATALLGGGFPDGVAWYTRQKFTEESLRVGSLLAWLGEQAEQVRLATAEDLVAELARAHGVYAGLIAAHHKGLPPDFDAVRAGELANHRAYLEAVVQVLAWTGTQPAEQRAALRAELLGPVIEQDEAVAAQLKDRRAVKDVDPETGEPEA